MKSHSLTLYLESWHSDGWVIVWWPRLLMAELGLPGHPHPGVKNAYFNFHLTGAVFDDHSLNSLMLPTSGTKFIKHEIYVVPSTVLSLLLSVLSSLIKELMWTFSFVSKFICRSTLYLWFETCLDFLMKRSESLHRVFPKWSEKREKPTFLFSP